jgi:uncharacterized protein YgiM (DUF1202 family)
MRKKILFLFFNLFVVLTFWHFAAGNTIAQEVTIEDFTGSINGDNVNIRSGASTNFEILRKMDDGEMVLVVGSFLDWYKIKLPRNSKAYVNKKFVRMDSPVYGHIVADRVNIRAGKGTNFNVIGQLNTNDLVEVLEKDPEWYQIYSDKNCYAWVFQKYINNQGPSSIFASQESKDQEAWKLFHQAKIFEQTNQNNDEVAEEKAAAIQKYNAIIRDYPNTQAAESSKKQISRLSKKTSAPNKQSAEKSEMPKKSVTEKQDQKKKVEQSKQTKKVLLSKPTSDPIAEGKLIEAGRFLFRPGTHKLLENKQTKFYLKSDTVDLNTYIYHKVQIWGKIVSSKKAKIPVIEVEYVHQLN